MMSEDQEYANRGLESVVDPVQASSSFEGPESVGTFLGVPSFENIDVGLEAVMTKIRLLLSEQDHAIVAVNGAHANVGKSELGRRIMARLDDLNVPVYARKATSKNVSSFSLYQLNFDREQYNTEKVVILFYEEGLYAFYEEGGVMTRQRIEAIRYRDLRRHMKAIGLEDEDPKFDFWVGIHTSWYSFSESYRYDSSQKLCCQKPVMDLLILNDEAYDK